MQGFFNVFLKIINFDLKTSKINEKITININKELIFYFLFTLYLFIYLPTDLCLTDGLFKKSC
jgi:hypothetical protein